MASGSWSVVASVEIVAADEHRDELTVQLTNRTPAVLGFGKAAVSGEGIRLINAGDSITVHGHLAREAVCAKMDAIGISSDGIWQDGKIEYRPGPQST